MGIGSRRLSRNQTITAINAITNALPTGQNKIGKVSHSNTGIGDGRKEVTTAGTAETLVASSTPCTKVNIQAEKNNTGIICVGGSSVVAAEATRRGIALGAGQTITIEIDDLVKLYLDSTVSTDGVTYNYFKEA